MKKQNSEKIAIIALTRGYDGNLIKYSDLIKRNNLIFKNIQLSSSYDLKIILFHEGNISDKDQNYIINNTNYLAGSNLNLIDGIFNTYNFSNVKLYQSIEMASFNPKKFLKKYANISLNIFDKNHYLIIDPSKNSILHSIYL